MVTPSGSTTSRSAATILLVDDYPPNLVALDAILEPLGQNVVHASSGDAALRALGETECAVVLLDVLMPGLNGLQTAARIKQREELRNVPIIFVSAADRTPAELVAAYEHGAVDYITKPYEPAILRAKVAVFVELFAQREHIKRQAALIAAHEHETLLLAREQQARVEAERAARTRDDLLAVVSHDLRDPLSAILTGAALVRRILAVEGPSERALDHLQRIERSAKRMEVLIRDLLDIAAIESGHLSVDVGTHDAGALVADGIELLRAAADEKAVRLEVAHRAPGTRVACDKDRIAQVFGNIVGNAIKFTPAGGRITIETRAGTDANEIEFAVADTGPGIAPDQLPRVFDRFWQAKETARAGAGLGLAICRGIVERHHGRIWVESALGTGTIFRFVLPVATGAGSGRRDAGS
jgi:two-component system sensor histidine kinase/response regulator